MEKRSSAVTVLFEPTIRRIMQNAYTSLSSDIHDLVVKDLIDRGILTNEVLLKALGMEAVVDTPMSNEEMEASDLAYDAARERGRLT